MHGLCLTEMNNTLPLRPHLCFTGSPNTNTSTFLHHLHHLHLHQPLHQHHLRPWLIHVSVVYINVAPLYIIVKPATHYIYIYIYTL